MMSSILSDSRKKPIISNTAPTANMNRAGSEIFPVRKLEIVCGIRYSVMMRLTVS